MLLAHLLSGLVLGAASLPHCALMCGPLVAATCASSKSTTGRSSLTFVLTRCVGYASLGALVGSLGGSLLEGLPVRWTEAALALAMAGYLLWAGGRILRGGRPQRVSLARRKPVPRQVRVPAWALGLGTSLLPCGALFGAYLVASVSGNALGGAVTMLGFSVASAPALAAASGLLGWLRSLERPTASKILSSAVFAGALVMVWRAYSALQQTGGSCCTG